MDGACRENGTEEAQGSVGVWFGEGESDLGSEYNVSELSRAKTSQQAEIGAAIRALRQYCTLLLDGVLDRQHEHAIILKSDSEYLVKGITEHIKVWKENGWKNAQGEKVANKRLWKTLDGLVGALEESGVRVLFWKVPRRWNTLADALAKDAFVDDESDGKFRAVDMAREEYEDGRKEWMQEYVDECKELGFEDYEDDDE